MSYNRKVRIEYYQVVICFKDGANAYNEKLYNLEELLTKVDQFTLEERTFDYYQEEARLDKMKYNALDSYWYLNFVRMRQTKIPSKAKKNMESEPITLLDDEYIGEEVTAVYDVENHIISLQRNRDSLSSTGIEYYLTVVLNKRNHEIKLRPIAPVALEKKLGRTTIYRRMTIKFANIPNTAFIGDMNTSFGKLLGFFNEFSAKTAAVTVSLGYAKKGTLDSDTVKETVKILKENKGLISSAELFMKESDIDPVDTIDLFSMKSHDFITLKLKKLETIKFEDIADEIHTKYNKSKPVLLEALNS